MKPGIAIVLSIVAAGGMLAPAWQPAPEASRPQDLDPPPRPAPAACESAPAPACPCAADNPIIDDAKIMRSFSASLSALLKQGKATTGATLRGQLSRKQCTVKGPVAPARRLDPVALYRRACQSVLVVGGIFKCTKCTRWHTSSASGFAVAAPNVIATNYHVVEKKDRAALGAMSRDGKLHPVLEVLAANKDADVAILRVGGGPLVPLSLRPAAPVGTPVWVVSHPVQKYYSFTDGMISRHFWVPRSGRRTPWMAITAAYAKGSSGGPVLDATGAVVGMVSRTSSIYYKKVKNVNTNLQMVVKSCVPAAAIRGCLAK